MEVILFNILIILIYALILNLSSLNKSTERFLFLTIAFFHLMFLHTFFDPALFPDLDNYYSYFSSILSSNVDDVNLEIGWNVLNRILYGISNNGFILLFFVSLIIILCYTIAINRYSAIPWISIFLFLCTVFYDSLFVLRQHLAMAICLLSIPYIIERKLIKFLLVTLIAVSFHISALIWIPIYILYSLEINKRFVFLLIIVSGLFYFSTEIILKNLVLLTTNILAYTDAENQGSINALKGSAVVLSTLFLSLFSFKKVDKFVGYNKLFFQLSMIAFILNFLPFLGSSFTLFSRLHLYYSMSGIFLIPNALANMKNKELSYILIPLICISYLFLLNSIVQYGYEF